MIIILLNGNLVYLCSIEREDLEQLRVWRNNPEYRKFFREYREISRDMQENWYQKSVLNDKSTIMFSIKSIETNCLLGCCGLCYINWVNKNSDLSIFIGYNDEYIDELGYAEESCKILFKYGFDELGLVKIWTEIYEMDYKKKALFNKIGMKQDGVLRKQYFHDGKYWNSYLLSILNDEFTE